MTDNTHRLPHPWDTRDCETGIYDTVQEAHDRIALIVAALYSGSVSEDALAGAAGMLDQTQRELAAALN